MQTTPLFVVLILAGAAGAPLVSGATAEEAIEEPFTFSYSGRDEVLVIVVDPIQAGQQFLTVDIWDCEPSKHKDAHVTLGWFGPLSGLSYASDLMPMKEQGGVDQEKEAGLWFQYRTEISGGYTFAKVGDLRWDAPDSRPTGDCHWWRPLIFPHPFQKNVTLTDEPHVFVISSGLPFRADIGLAGVQLRGWAAAPGTPVRQLDTGDMHHAASGGVDDPENRYGGAWAGVGIDDRYQLDSASFVIIDLTAEIRTPTNATLPGVGQIPVEPKGYSGYAVGVGGALFLVDMRRHAEALWNAPYAGEATLRIDAVAGKVALYTIVVNYGPLLDEVLES